MSPPRQNIVAQCLAAVCGASMAAAQIPAAPGADAAIATVAEPEELVELRTAFESQLESRSAPARKRLVDALRQLERSRADRGDYEGARRAQRRRQSIERAARAAPSSPAEPQAPGQVEIALRSGRRTGSSLHYDAARDALVGFGKSGHSVTWDINSVQPGDYRVLVTYGCADFTLQSDRVSGGATRTVELTTGGSFTVEEATSLATGEDRVLRHTVYPTGGWDKTVTRNIGRLRLTGTTSTVKLSALAPEPGGLMALRRLRLVPVDARGQAGGSHPLDELKSRYGAKVAEITGDDFRDHIEALRRLETSLAGSDRLRDALAVKAERERIERAFSADPAAAAHQIITAPAP